jgi:predicted Zn-dependent protease
VLRQLAALSPDRPESWHALARFLERTGQPAQAAEAEARARGAEARPRRALRPLPPSSR